MEKQRADFQLQGLIVLIAFLPVALLPLVFIGPFRISLFAGIMNGMVSLVYCGIVFWYFASARRVWFDGDNIYLKKFWPADEEVIPYRDVVVLTEQMLRPGITVRECNLVYQSVSGRKKIRFFSSVRANNVEKLKAVIFRSKEG